MMPLPCPVMLRLQKLIPQDKQTEAEEFLAKVVSSEEWVFLICRLIDRPLRPTMLKDFYHETQILSWVLSYDGLHSPDSLAVTAAGIAVALSEVPNSKTVAGVRISLVGDKFIVNPTTKEIEDSELNLLLAGQIVQYRDMTLVGNSLYNLYHFFLLNSCFHE